jgi:uncharacterized FAD-dependent dehydrogenase
VRGPGVGLCNAAQMHRTKSYAASGIPHTGHGWTNKCSPDVVDEGATVSTTRRYDEQFVVVGAGPAGLAAAAAAGTTGAVPLLLEAGPSLEDRDQSDPQTVVEGVGGAGLFSDGKFSFRPSASRLWDLDARLLGPSWNEIAGLLKAHGIAVEGSLGDEDDRGRAVQAGPGPGYVVKRYPSVYGTPQSRHELVAALQGLSPRRQVGVRVTGLRRHGRGWAVHTTRGTVTTRRAVLATGRFGPELLTSLSGDGTSEIVMTPRRLEAGVRLQQRASEFFLRDIALLDPKLIWASGDDVFEWRTFCCCRDGLVLPTLTQGLWTVSGRADCPPTGTSNVGFNLRITDPELIDREWPGLSRRLQELRSPVTVGLDEFIEGGGEDLRRVLGPWLAAGLADGLQHLCASFPNGGLETAVLVGPALEGVGRYPAHDQRLQAAPRLWVAGDVTGSFRGLTAALVSGHMAGTAALAENSHAGAAR